MKSLVIGFVLFLSQMTIAQNFEKTEQLRQVIESGAPIILDASGPQALEQVRYFSLLLSAYTGQTVVAEEIVSLEDLRKTGEVLAAIPEIRSTPQSSESQKSVQPEENFDARRSNTWLKLENPEWHLEQSTDQYRGIDGSVGGVGLIFGNIANFGFGISALKKLAHFSGSVAPANPSVAYTIELNPLKPLLPRFPVQPNLAYRHYFMVNLSNSLKLVGNPATRHVEGFFGGVRVKMNDRAEIFTALGNPEYREQFYVKDFEDLKLSSAPVVKKRYQTIIVGFTVYFKK